MEKKGNFINQLAIIADLIEKINADILTSTILYEVNSEEFNKIHQQVAKKFSKSNIALEDTFSIKMGKVDIIFNKSNV